MYRYLDSYFFLILFLILLIIRRHRKYPLFLQKTAVLMLNDFRNILLDLCFLFMKLHRYIVSKLVLGTRDINLGKRKLNLNFPKKI